MMTTNLHLCMESSQDFLAGDSSPSYPQISASIFLPPIRSSVFKLSSHDRDRQWSLFTANPIRAAAEGDFYSPISVLKVPISLFLLPISLFLLPFAIFCWRKIFCFYQ